MIKASLHTKIFSIVLGLLIIGVTVFVYWSLKSKKAALLQEKFQAARLMAHPILDSIYGDMLEERADLARHLLNTLKTIKDAERVQIIRSNGIEEAFQDFKTIEAVKKEFGEVKHEWVANHPDREHNIAEGVESPEFKNAFERLKKNWATEGIYYIEKADGKRLFTYLQPIEQRSKCNSCHNTEDARGILMISLSLEDMYKTLATTRNQWVATGLLTVFLGSIFLSFTIRKSITEPIEKTVRVLRKISDNKGNITEKLKIESKDEIGYLAKTFNNMLDILKQKDDEQGQLMERIIKSQEEWMATFDAIRELISIHDRNSVIIKVNKALARKLGAEPRAIVGRKCADTLYRQGNGPQVCHHNKTLETGGIETALTEHLSFDGTYEITTYPIYNEPGQIWAVVHVARDITAEKTLREQLIHSEKLSSIGRLVAGIAHELNNPLMSIMGFAQLLINTPGDKKVEDIKDKLQKIYNESGRTAKIVQNLLTFARSRKSEKAYCDINNILEQTLDIREYSLATSNITVTLDLAPDIPKTMIDFYQMQQVFINLINNAVDAITDYKEKGAIAIKTAMSTDGMIEISFKDDGPGIPNDKINNVFDPFFTTKDIGKGTGLGLSISYGIVTEHGGRIDIKSHEEGGAIVTISMPVIGKADSHELKRPDREAGQKPLNMASGPLLVVDDEGSIREALSETLSGEGFLVETAANGQEALDKMEKVKFSLIITDMKMPGISGIELYETILKRHPRLKGRVIIMTGDVISADTKDFFRNADCHYMLKPFNVKELIKLARKLLSSTAAQG